MPENKPPSAQCSRGTAERTEMRVKTLRATQRTPALVCECSYKVALNKKKPGPGHFFHCFFQQVISGNNQIYLFIFESCVNEHSL